MGRVWGPFVLGSTALLCASVIYSSQIFPNWEQPTQIVAGLALWIFASIVLYAVMETRQVTVVHIADWPKMRSTIFALGVYAGAALLTFGFTTYVRLHQCSASPPCAVILAKGAVWSAIWPIFWPRYLRGWSSPG